MSLQSIDRPVPLAHRPMSLLLQALRQIETKAPLKPTEDASSTATVVSTATNQSEVASQIYSPLTSLPDSSCEEPSFGGRFETIRVYHPSEIDSEIAVAGPAQVASVPLVEVSPEPASAAKPSRTTRRRRLADEIVALLPDGGRSVIALTSMDGTDLWPLADDLCSELAEAKQQQVLAVAGMRGLSHKRRSAASVERLSLHDDWHAFLRSAAADGVSVLDRRELENARDISCRALLDLWGRILDEFAYVVVDAASRNSPLKTPILATSDATFLVVKLGDTSRRQVEQELSRIRTIGGRPCGCLVV